MFFTYFYTSIIFNPVDLAENLKKQGGFIPGVKPGTKTAEYIDEVMSRITLPGAIFLTFIALLPIWIRRADQRALPFRWHVVADRRRRRAGHAPEHEPAPAAQKVRWVHEEGAQRRSPRGGAVAGRRLLRDRGPTWLDRQAAALRTGIRRAARGSTVIVLLGPPGAGKGTQAARSLTALGIPRSVPVMCSGRRPATAPPWAAKRRRSWIVALSCRTR